MSFEDNTTEIEKFTNKYNLANICTIYYTLYYSKIVNQNDIIL